MPHPFPIFIQSDYLIQVVGINSNTEWQIVQILQKPTDLDLHCLQKQGISGFSTTRVDKWFSKNVFFHYAFPHCSLMYNHYSQYFDGQMTCNAILVMSPPTNSDNDNSLHN